MKFRLCQKNFRQRVNYIIFGLSFTNIRLTLIGFNLLFIFFQELEKDE